MGAAGGKGEREREKEREGLVPVSGGVGEEEKSGRCLLTTLPPNRRLPLPLYGF